MGRFQKMAQNTKFGPNLGWLVIREKVLTLSSQYLNSTTCGGPACSFFGHFDAPKAVLVLLRFRILSSIFFFSTRKIL